MANSLQSGAEGLSGGADNGCYVQFCFLHIIWIGNDKKSALLLSSFFCCWLAMVLGLDLSKISEEYLYLRLHIHTTQ